MRVRATTGGGGRRSACPLNFSMERRLDDGLQRLPQPAQCIESCLPLLIVATDRYEAVQSGLGDDGFGSSPTCRLCGTSVGSSPEADRGGPNVADAPSCCRSALIVVLRLPEPTSALCMAAPNASAQAATAGGTRGGESASGFISRRPSNPSADTTPATSMRAPCTVVAKAFRQPCVVALR